MPKTPTIMWVVGLINAVIAAVSPLLAHGTTGGIIALIAVAGAALSAIASYVASNGVKRALLGAQEGGKRL